MPHTPQTMRHFEEHLRHQQKQLEKSMTSAVAQGREAATDDTRDVADQAVQSYQKELLFRQSSSGHEQLSLVRLALERLQDGTYGECIYCGNTIGAKRLEAVPWTPCCIGCQEKIERGELEDPVRAA
jgi:DnaK suppressor protein